MTTELFVRNLNKFNITLEEDAAEYINSMLNDMSLNETDEIKESTESFLIDANIDEKTRDEFYKALIAGGASKGAKLEQHEQPVRLLDQKDRKTKLTNESHESNDPSNKQLKSAIVTPRQTRRRGKLRDQENGEKEPEIVAITQQSRFHTETIETLNKELDLHGVNITVNQNDLLVDAHLRLKANTRYGLVGQNGVGKSILLKCLADNIMVGLPQNLNILHISQLEDFDESKTAVEEVLESDKKATAALREYGVLHAVLGDDRNQRANKDLNNVVFSIMQSRLSEKVENAQKIATKRSGLRGREARKELIKCEKEQTEFNKLDPQAYVTSDMVNDMISEVYEKVQLIDQGERKHRASKLLKGLGFSEKNINSPLTILSGGWRMRVALAKSLFLKPDILLLDEPTNHLDLPAILWLQEYIINETNDMIVVVVSHDREFLNNVTDETIIFKDKILKYHAGNYEDWERNTEEQRIRKQTLLNNTEKRRKAIQASIQHNAQQAKATGDDKRHGMINSRKKKLERLGMEKTEDGKRFKVSYRAGYHLSSHEEIIVEKGVKTASIKIPQPTALRYRGPVLTMKDVTFRYKGDAKDAIKKFSINIEPNARIAFIGPNGCGKTTLLNMLTEKTRPTSGEVYRHSLLRIGYFSQHIVDQLDMDISPVKHMMIQYPSLSEQECRAYFGMIGITGNVVLRKIRSLSGGQRSRIALALILYEQPHVLVLDEITNHLDMGTVEMLVDALEEYSGAVVLVSHDVWFLKQVFEGPLYDDSESDKESQDDEDEFNKQNEIYVIENGNVRRWEQGIDAYVASVLKKVKKNK
ncbi:hypothetical protein G6F62_002357 [Rhizopus arrhizus]|nr:hypothetical protein G6F23_000094 [Rhizopus arrhizus]KAG1300047.1 hypothetical protein G6F66_000289 [Rhizopus arrhizus]KAG1353775.1 hypothetical protein G6F62_002357 [Rhizopus arrhizus]KAG1381203.1 hypothetical protein G6F61_003369 [Rhizopus arrhizus]